MQLNAKNQESTGKKWPTKGIFETLGTNMDERTGRNNGTRLNRYDYPKYLSIIFFRSSPEFKFKTPWSTDRFMDWLSMSKNNQMNVESW